MTDNRIYLGRVGALAALRSPRGTLDAPRARRTSTFELGVGGAAVDQMIGGSRTYTINYEQLQYADFVTLQAYADGHEGPGPFVLLDPGQRNQLPANIAGATSVTNSTDGGPTGSFELLGVSDDYNRAAVASGWGSTVTGQAYTISGGANANYAANGTRGTMAITSTAVERTVSLANIGPNVDITVYLRPGEVATGAQFEQKARIRHAGGATFYESNVQYQTDGTITFYLVRGVTVLTAVANALTYTATSVIGLHFQATGSTIRHTIWDATSGAPEPDAWTSSTTDATFAGNATDSVHLVGNRITGNTNTSLTLAWDDLHIVAEGVTLSSSTAYTDAGPRVLACTFAAAPAAGALPVISVAWPSSTFTHGVPVVAGRAVCYSAYLRGGGADPVSTWALAILWRDVATGALVSTTTGTPVASASGAWAQLTVQGTPPATGVYADVWIVYASGATAGTVAYFRRFMFNEGDTPDTTWAPGTGVWPVRVVSLGDTWPYLSPELRAGPVFTLTEDTA